MKNFVFKLLAPAILFVGLFAGCTEDFEELNTNPTKLTAVDAASVGNAYARAQYRGMFGEAGGFQLYQSLFADLYAQYFGNVATYFPSDRHVIVGRWVNGAWSAFYSQAVVPWLIVRDATIDQPKEQAVAQIWKVQMFHRITDYWGPIPYLNIGNGERTVAYDAQDVVYDDFFKTLASATQTLNGLKGQNAFGTNDQIYQGSVDKWILFANTLRLRLALRISNVDPARAKTEAEAAVAGGVIETNADNAIMRVSSNSQNPIGTITSWNEFRMSASMESILKGYEDPRMAQYFSPVDGTTNTFKGVRNGLNPTQQALAENSPNANSNMHPRWLQVSRDNTPIHVILSAESHFLRAEGALKGWNMGGTAKSFYETGIRRSMEYYGFTGAPVDAYVASTKTPIALNDFLNTPALSDIPVAFDEANTAKALEQIHTQKWLALYPDGVEAWANYRRSGLPKLYVRVNSENTDSPADAILRRITFVDGEKISNADAVKQAESLLGGADKSNTPVWWNK